ncbi:MULTISPECIES: TIGR03943 family putative permease subunit [unclassified Mycolicibacterium]|uniref:TIGR03943 family putative permease subunit n=1 Tax=unclassified Mycolicibacterium TaxID=2636767 RepID=UPI0012DC0E64|nr:MULTISPECIES: TIGR03943 family protein [unclassified Mycolicibacterium]MUL84077.1 TIGR03943 family protein [Mycolicibacterium sp. CBMA 329]MUL89857.1 TIGR03943 family protein [Mycolicibacterium sp. CBMA 331]MUM00034.1 TIGR03943 family protein [Mycolicibacterium sp. CBMA 334]MUM28961.1 TIGR03943 family protein [Mycolicibacterium sp. CBMA 295]MUM39372.1 TIGR03943 family protein [Mycolicibacterium sp. CBMA 247]
MSRETENALLLLIGVSTAIIAVTGTFTRYVKPALLPYLAATAVLLIALALAAIVRDIRHGGRQDDEHDTDEPHDHPHSRGVAWLLLVPIALLAFVVPPAIRPDAAKVTEVSTDALRRPFPPLPDGPAPEISLPDALIRVAQDTAGTLDNRTITVTGFTMRDGDRTDLARVVIICCAADAQLASIRLSGPGAAAVAGYPENTWIKVEGTIPAGQNDSSRRSVPTMTALTVSRIDPPPHPYAY